ncbi:TPA: hypothetical protein EYO12_00540 [Candidatus Saccharibacteria bacterium]|nr:hypothetical protein [Candidatus Saccharibacteria bacterium]HIO87583.1 hypothetical protein [Candidatus Saccharibacteria bacterium]
MKLRPQRNRRRKPTPTSRSRGVYKGTTTNTSRQQGRVVRRSSSRVESTIVQKMLSYGVFIGLTAGILVWLVMFSRVNHIEYEGPLDDGLVQEISNEYFEQTSRWRFAFDSASFERYLRQRAPFFTNVTTHIGIFSDTMTIRADNLPTRLLWQSNGVQYEVNQLGYISQSKDQLDELPIVFDAARLEYSVGQKLLPERVVAFISELTAVVASQSDVSYFEGINYVAGQSTESLTLQTSQNGPKFLVSTSIDPQAQIDSILDLYSKLSQEGRAAPKEYVDTRVAGRVFWK